MPFSTIYSKIKTFANGGTLLPADLNSALDDLGNQVATANVALGVNEGPNTRRGKFRQSVPGYRTAATFGDLTNGPDVVNNIVLESDGLLFVSYRAVVSSDTSYKGSVSLFVDEQRVKVFALGDFELRDNEGRIERAANVSDVKTTMGVYVFQTLNDTSFSYTNDASTGQLMGKYNSQVYYETIAIAAPAGTHSVSVRYNPEQGTMTARNRILRVTTKSFS